MRSLTLWAETLPSRRTRTHTSVSLLLLLFSALRLTVGQNERLATLVLLMLLSQTKDEGTDGVDKPRSGTHTPERLTSAEEHIRFLAGSINKMGFWQQSCRRQSRSSFPYLCIAGFSL